MKADINRVILTPCQGNIEPYKSFQQVALNISKVMPKRVNEVAIEIIIQLIPRDISHFTMTYDFTRWSIVTS